MTQDTWNRSVITAMLAFALGAGVLTLVGLLLVVLREADALADAIATASIGGTGLSVGVRLCRKGGK